MSVHTSVCARTSDADPSQAETQLAGYLTSIPSNMQKVACANLDRRTNDPDVEMPIVAQLELPNFGLYPPARKPLKVRSKTRSAYAANDDVMLERYRRSLKAHGAAERAQSAYTYQLRTALRSAARIVGGPVTWYQLLSSEELLGRTLVDDIAFASDARLSKWTLAQRRSAIRSFVSLLGPDLRKALGTDPSRIVDQALKRVAERAGTGYRLPGGRTRKRGGDTPAADEITSLLREIGQTPGYVGTRNAAFFSILTQAGIRVNALRELDGSNCLEMPDGRIRLYLHEKGKREPREVELTRASSDVLRSYVQKFNDLAAVRRWHVRIRLGAPGAVWRNSARGRWTYAGIRATLTEACEHAGIQRLTPHALRRAFATQAASLLPRHLVALAGGWQGTERLDNHYIHPRTTTIAKKLSLGSSYLEHHPEEDHHGKATLPIFNGDAASITGRYSRP